MRLVGRRGDVQVKGKDAYEKKKKYFVILSRLDDWQTESFESFTLQKELLVKQTEYLHGHREQT